MSSSCLVGIALKWHNSLSLHEGITVSYLNHSYSPDITDIVHVVGILSTARFDEIEVVV